jgi:hypothetical protein
MSIERIRKDGSVVAGDESVTIGVTSDNMTQLLKDFSELRNGRSLSLTYIAGKSAVRFVRGATRFMRESDVNIRVQLDDDMLHDVIADLEILIGGGKANANHYDRYLPIKGKDYAAYLITSFAEGMYQFDDWPDDENHELVAFAREWDRRNKK